MVERKGIIISALCTNPSCPHSEEELIMKQPFQQTLSSGKCSFVMPIKCPKCLSGVEVLNFVSGTIEIEKDL